MEHFIAVEGWMFQESFAETRSSIEHALRILQEGRRPCSLRKKYDEIRPVELETGVVEGSLGSVLVRQGCSVVVCGVKGEFGPTDEKNPSAGCIDVAVHFPEISGLSFAWPQETLQQTRRSIAQFVQDQMDSSVPLEQLIIKEGEVCWVLRTDITVISLDGSLRDLCLLAATAATFSVSLPEATLSDGQTKTTPKRLHFARIPLALTVSVFDEGLPMRMLADPSGVEEAAASSIVTLVIDAKTMGLMGVQLHGSGGVVSRNVLKCCSEFALRHCQQLKTLL